MPRYTEPVFPVKKVVGLTADLAERIRDYRFAQRIESENEAIRRLIEAGLSKAKSASPSGGAGCGTKKPATGNPAAPRPRKAGQERNPAPSPPQSKEAQLRALREQGGR
jgi:hypothetical protein